MAQVKLPKLFVELESQRTTREQRAYVTDELVRMVQDGSLYLTAVLNQRPNARQIAGDVIFGHGVSDGHNSGMPAGQHVTTFPIPSEIRRATVTLEAISPHTSIRWVDGSKEMEGIVVGSRNQYNVPQWEHNWVEVPGPRADLALRDAWLALKRFGEHVVKADLPQDKKDLWHCREVQGSVKDGTRPASDDQPRGKRRDTEARV